MTRARAISAVLGLAAMATLASPAGAATVADRAPRIAGAAATFTIVQDGKGHYVSLGAVVRPEHALTDRQRRTFALLAGPLLRAGQSVPDELFGGTSLGRIGDKTKHCYAAEVAQLRRHASVRSGARWRLAFTDGRRVAAQVKTVILRRGTPEGAAARRLGC